MHLIDTAYLRVTFILSFWYRHFISYLITTHPRLNPEQVRRLQPLNLITMAQMTDLFAFTGSISNLSAYRMRGHGESGVRALRSLSVSVQVADALKS
jgi:hypothetical protein